MPGIARRWVSSGKRRFVPVALLMLATTACAQLKPPPPITKQASDIAGLWRIFGYAGIAVAAIVYVLILWCVVRYRRRSDETPPQFRNNIPLEAVYITIPVLLVAGLFVLTFRTETMVNKLSAKPDVVVHVEAFQWSWRFNYEGSNVSVTGTQDQPPVMVLPVGPRIRFQLISDDVIHAFFVPDFLFKRDNIPGRTNEFEVTLTHFGTFGGKCAEFCGLDHARMLFTLRAVSVTEFDAWLRAQQGAPA